ncbi:MAG: hypothetical protein ABJE66_02695 [Deltaproteobacteria bacterium]
MSRSLDPLAAAYRVAMPLDCTLNAEGFPLLELQIDGQRATLQFLVVKTRNVSIAWSEIAVPVSRRYPLAIFFRQRRRRFPYGRRKKDCLQAAPREVADLVLDRSLLAPLRDLQGLRLVIATDSTDALKRFVKLRFEGWLVDSTVTRKLIEHVIGLAHRIPEAFAQATQANETLRVSHLPFREQLEVATRSDPVPQWFVEVQAFRRRIRTRLALEIVATVIVVAAAVTAIGLHG